MLNVMLNGKDQIVTLVPEGELKISDFEVASQIIDTFIKKHGKLNGIIISSEHFPKWKNFAALLKHLKFINEYHEKVLCVAIVCDSLRAEILGHFASHFISALIENFSYEKHEDAKTWILQDKQNINNHGLSIGIQRTYNNFILKFKACGQLTHNDYDVINPMIDSALNGINTKNVKVLVDLSEFDGWELRAAWDDLKIGLKHGFDFEKIAIYGNTNKVLEYGLKISSWFLCQEVKEFSNQKNAILWLENRA